MTCRFTISRSLKNNLTQDSLTFTLMKKGVIIQGSARINGDTSTYVQQLKAMSGFEVVDLKAYKIGHFDYEFKNKDDDFHPLIKRLLTNFDIFVFATPVYWYSMSGHTKVFLDRISDLLQIDKETGRLFRGKAMAVLSVSGQDDVDTSFYVPFNQSAVYLGMRYLGKCHAFTDGEDSEIETRLKRFSDSLT